MDTFLGCYVKPDEWRLGDKLTKSDWDKSDYRLATSSSGPIKSLAVNVQIIGHKERWDCKNITGPAMRCRITFVGDDEPDIISGGWIKVTE